MTIATYERDDVAQDDLAQGPWQTERETQRYLANFLRDTGLFFVCEQVKGMPLYTHPRQEHHSLQADILALPTEKLCQAGWCHGAIIFEVKRPGAKIGRGLNQLLDYVNSAWYMNDGVLVVPSFGFLFWAQAKGGPVASIMAQQHIGTAELNHRNELEMRCGGQTVLRLTASGHIVKLGRINFGHKIGSR